VTATASAGYAFVDWTEGGSEVSTSAVYAFTASASRNLVANFAPIFTIITSASPSAGGTTSGDGTFLDGSSVTVNATANSAYTFVNWTEGGVEVSTSASYTFAATANRALVANFTLRVVDLQITAATAVRSGSKIVVTVTVENVGDEAALAVKIAAKKDALLGTKTTSNRVPVLFGDLYPGHWHTEQLIFGAVKRGSQMLRLRLTYTGGVESPSFIVTVP
jgi:hypothetical protein